MASLEFGLPVFDLRAINREMLPEQQIDGEMMLKQHAVPLFRRGNRPLCGRLRPHEPRRVG